jgi:hypothetical protein
MSRSAASLHEKLFRENLQDRVRHLHEILPEKMINGLRRQQEAQRDTLSREAANDGNLP